MVVMGCAEPLLAYTGAEYVQHLQQSMTLVPCTQQSGSLDVGQLYVW